MPQPTLAPHHTTPRGSGEAKGILIVPYRTSVRAVLRQSPFHTIRYTLNLLACVHLARCNAMLSIFDILITKLLQQSPCPFPPDFFSHVFNLLCPRFLTAVLAIFVQELADQAQLDPAVLQVGAEMARE